MIAESEKTRRDACTEFLAATSRLESISDSVSTLALQVKGSALMGRLSPSRIHLGDPPRIPPRLPLDPLGAQVIGRLTAWMGWDVWIDPSHLPCGAVARLMCLDLTGH